MLRESIDYLVKDKEGIYIDGTLGGGGHAAEIIRRLDSGGKLIAFDKDEEAINHCREKFVEELARGKDSRITFFNLSYDLACSTERIGGKAKGFLLDLGVSSRQLDSDEKGFSYRVNTKLDLRFGSQGKTAETLIDEASEGELERILKVYGEEPFAKTIARRIIQRRRAIPLKTTFDLKQVIEECVPPKLRLRSLSRVFQAIRIDINDELGVLERALNDIIPFMDIGGRIVVISYHSLEDRIVKNTFRRYSKKVYQSDSEAIQPQLKILTPKPLTPPDEEIALNPRARSAKLRVAERI